MTAQNDFKFTSDIVIGLEIHITLNTQSKLFCSCSNQFSQEPNKNVCPVCLGHPGTRPTLNEKAVNYAIKLAKALHCDIAPRLIFSRKTYFYPDLVKNFQTTQYEEPLGKNGYIMVDDKKINLERIHLEEDPGALIHKNSRVLVDYNRSGSPLCEIVTKPEMTSPKEAREFIKKLVTIVSYLGIFDYENGAIKADLNISIKQTGYKRTEIKGVSGFKDIEDALDYEVRRHQTKTGEVIQETRGYDNQNKITFSQRKKEDEQDYGYIYEPDLVPRDITKKIIEKNIKEMPRMVDERINDYTNKGMDYENAKIITSIKEVSDTFEKSISKGADFNLATKLFRRDIISAINDRLISRNDLLDNNFSESIVDILKLFSERKINNHSVKRLLEELCKSKNMDVKESAKKNNMLIESNIDLDSVCGQAIKNSEQAVNDYLSGKPWAINYIVGQVMKLTKGQAMPDEVKEKLTKKLDDMK